MARQGKVEAFEYISDADMAANGGLVQGPKTKINIENLATAAVPDASETVKGKAELATLAEAIAGADTSRIVTPAGLAAAIAAATLAPKILFGVFATGGGALTAQNILVNTFGEVPVITKAASGKYDITFSGPVLEDNRVFVFGGSYYDSAGGQWSSHAVLLSTSVVRFITAAIAGSIGDITLTNIPVGILVWPSA